MTDKQRAAKVLELLAERYPDLETHLMAESPWELLVATVLAAQCTDKRVNQVTPELFRRWPDPAALAQATIPELEEVIHSVGFYHSKAKHLIAAAQLVVKEFNGETPNTMKDLIKLPGVARKTANVVLWGGFGINEGLAVDTHVKRISRAPRAHQAYRSRGHRKGSGQTVPAIRMGQGQPPDGLVRPPCL